MATPADSGTAAPTGWISPSTSYKHALIPIIVLIVGGAVLAHFQRPFAMQAMMTRMPPEALARVGEMSNSPIFLITTLSAGVVRVLGVAISAGGAFLVLSGMFAAPVFRRVFVAAAWAALLYLLRDAVRLGTLMYRGLETVRAPEDLVPGIGLGFLVTNRQSLAYELLELFNVYDLAYLWIFAGLLCITESVRAPKAIVAGLVPWLLLNAIGITFRALFLYN